MQHPIDICTLWMMKKLYSILSTILGLVLLGSSFMQVSSHSDTDGKFSVTPPSEENGPQSTHPLDRPNLFTIYYQVESVDSLPSNIPVPQIPVDERDDAGQRRIAKCEAQNSVSVWLRNYKIIDRRPGVLKLIFPFHTYL